MIATIGILGCSVVTIVAACVSAAATIASATAGGVIAEQQKDAAEEANRKAEQRQLRTQTAQKTADERRTNQTLQAAARGILLTRIDNRQTARETDALNRKIAGASGTSRHSSWVSRGSYHMGNPA